MLIREKLENVCDRFYVGADRLRTYGKNCALEAKPQRRTVRADRAMRLCAEAMGLISRTAEGKSGLGRILSGELYRFQEAWESLSGLRGIRFPGCEGLPGALFLGMDLVRCGPDCAAPEAVESFVSGVEKHRRLTFDEARCLPLFARMALILFVGELCRREEEYSALLRSPEGKSGPEDGLTGLLQRGPGHVRGCRELSRGLEEQARIYIRVLVKYSRELLCRSFLSGCQNETELMGDPSGLYPASSEDSRGYVRRLISVQAKKSRSTEAEVISRLLSRADGERGVMGAALELEAPERLFKRGRILWLICAELLPVAGLVLCSVFGGIFCGILTYPLWRELCHAFCELILARSVPPRELFRLELENAVPLESSSLCVIALLADSAKSVREHGEKLLRYSLANRDCGENLRFGLLLDLPDSSARSASEDGEILKAAKDVTEELNRRYGARFFAAFRERSFSLGEGAYIPDERKRGAVLELAGLACGEKSGLRLMGAERPELVGTRYIIVLDSDTEPCPGSLKKLIGTASHPVNRARLSKDGRVVSGYGIIRPRVTVELSSGQKSLLSRIYGGVGGTDRYSSSLSERGWCLFGNADFTGKGIIDAGIFHRVLEGRLPRGRILSHDILEGGYVRCGYAGSVQFTEGFPSTVGGYFKRMGRWTRGDVQLLPWVLGLKRQYRTELSRYTAYEMGRNVLAALAPPLALGCILGFVWGWRGFGPAAAVALAWLLLPFLTSLVSGLFSPGAFFRRYRSGGFRGLLSGILSSVTRAILLPFEAWTRLRSVLLSLWRMSVSGRRLLEWVTAAEGDRHSPVGPLKTWFSMISCPVVAALTVLVGMDVPSFALAAVWMLAPLFGEYISRPLPRDVSLGKREQALLLDHAKNTAEYFRALFSEKTVLPSDNYQEQPFIGWADRTSPTNIGLSMLSLCGLARLGLMTWDEARTKCEGLVSAVEGLEKYRGNLYNWYSCSKAKPLYPFTVSSVDSGNFAACAAAAAMCFRRQSGEGFSGLASRLEKLWRSTDLSVFYRSDKKLLTIGLDGEKRAFEGAYDMLAGESRLTGFLAIAKGDVPAEHWDALSRELVSFRGFCGLSAWSGSLFEYLMPELLLPSPRGSLLWESGSLAVLVQKKRGAGLSLPWGLSESCFLKLESNMNYGYKPHGDPLLARGANDGREYVASPYSSFLALCCEPHWALKNLEHFRSFGALGKYGFFDAVELTPSRLPGDTEGMPVRTYMTHHSGMSLCAAVNALCGGFLSECFMSVPEISAFSGLLCERVPEGAVKKPLKRPAERKKPERPSGQEPELSFDSWDLAEPPLGIVSNLEMTSVLYANGDSLCRVGGDCVYRPEVGVVTSVFREGRSCFVKGPCREHGARRSFRVSGDRCEYTLELRSMRVCESVSVTRGATYERRTVEISSLAPCNVELTVYFEPQLCSDEKYRAHPEFERLKLELYLRSRGDGAELIRHDSRDGDRYYTVLWDRSPDRVCLSKSQLLGRGGTASLGTGKVSVPRCESSRGDPCVCAVFALSLPGGKSVSVSFAVGRGELPASNRNARGFITAARVFAGDRSSLLGALETAGAVLSGKGRRACYAPVGKEKLWELRISGDIPIVLLRAADFTSENEFLPEVFSALGIHRLLSRFGIAYDLAILCNDGGSYDRPGFNGVGMAVRLRGSEELLNARGGIHIIDSGSAPADAVRALETYGIFPGKLRAELLESKLPPAAPCVSDGALAGRIHSAPLADPIFGCVMGDIGPLLIYSRNSRLLKLMPWQNDPLAPECLGMELCAVHGGERYSLFGANDGMPFELSFLPGAVVWEKRIGGRVFRTEAWVSPGRSALDICVECRGEGGARLLWRFSPGLCEKESDSVHVRTFYSDGVFSAKNPVDLTQTELCALWSREPEKYGLDERAWLSNFESRGLPDENRCFCARFDLSPGEKLVLTLSADGKTAPVENAFSGESLQRALALRRFENLSLQTGNRALDGYMNTWSEYQIRVSRLWTRSSAFQNGGAFGFRDQLQDAAALLLTAPELLREQLLLCCAHQYAAGDVMHWFHCGAPHFCRGVRTRCSDDLLWLVRECSEYVLATGDTGLLDVRVKYLQSLPLAPEEPDRYEEVCYAGEDGTVFDHCLRALEQFRSRGVDGRGLPLMLGGDWNDGFSRVGEKGLGSSVWLGFFGAETLELFGSMCRAVGRELPSELVSFGFGICSAAFDAWDGDRFVRAWTDGGKPLGSKNSPYMSLDSLPQSIPWFLREVSGDNEIKRRIALDTALSLLKEPSAGVWRLFDRPVTSPELGYIGDYPPGVRENGGQYTHAAVWLAIACFRAGRADDGYGILRDILEPRKPEDYGGEVFVIPADVSDKGKCGWTWYTGSAGWFRRAVLEELLGIRLVMGELRVSPCLPTCMDGFCCELRVKNTLCRIRAVRTGTRCDGRALLSGGEVEISVTV